MACSKFEYVKEFERDDALLPECYIVVRLDGKCFTTISSEHNFDKPLDDRGLGLMIDAALHCMTDFPDIVLCYTQSDEVSFVFRKGVKLYNRREGKILSTLVSAFTGYYLMKWKRYLNCELSKLPVFDGRVIMYPNIKCLRDYLSWRQADCHINNLYNYTFWKLIENGSVTKGEVYERIKSFPRASFLPLVGSFPPSFFQDTNSAMKNEILFSECGINYNNLPQLHRKGTMIVRTGACRSGGNGRGSGGGGGSSSSGDQPSLASTLKDFGLDIPKLTSDSDYPVPNSPFRISHSDLIKDDWWNSNPEVLQALDS